MVTTLLLESSVPSRLWCEALSTSVHLINRLPSPTLNHASPFFQLFGHSPSYYDLRTFGCVCFLHLPAHERHKLTAQSIKCAFLDYTVSQQGYVCYDPHSQRIRISKNVVFFENQYFFTSHVEPPSTSLSVMPSFSDSPSVRAHLNRALCMHDILAMEHECWWQAMTAELQALEENHMWDVVPCPPHEFGVDYETVAPVAKMTIVRLILSIAASQSWDLHQLDVKNAFLHGDLHKEIYMKLPSGMTTSSSHDVCRLRCSLHGLKQAPRAWFEKFRSTLITFDFA
ncbi:unnamed protein product [Fraxinus pennsylvanica]|uniref:Reverse transcriptase Ty1/copia-type domain-containing protein n=1 Tax=Fraxinus pennsylvanica TaxID=56036 RepID=A0AAD2E8F5_9LAMI|nr:unnamed protein product [Fraxinus pennsylvanica]